MLLQAANITQLLKEARQGSESSAEKLMDAVYADLRKVARRYMAAERYDHTLQPTAIVNEVFLRMFRQKGEDAKDWQSVSIDWQNRVHFLGVAAKQMRQVLIDHSRGKKALKRDAIRLSLDDAESEAADAPQDFERLDTLLTLLASKDARAARVVELKFFGGLTDEESAEALGINVTKVRRDWTFARTWLRQRMGVAEKVAQRPRSLPLSQEERISNK
jgi:RNA polymerase sigma factor (TIGR02999 family)